MRVIGTRPILLPLKGPGYEATYVCALINQVLTLHVVCALLCNNDNMLSHNHKNKFCMDVILPHV